MKKPLFILLLISSNIAFFAGKSLAQDAPAIKSNAISFDLTRLMVNEVNMSIEHFLSARKSLELTGGLIYANEYWQTMFSTWENAVVFYEHGYAFRFHYKVFRRTDSKSDWKDYMSPGIIYKHLYYNDVPIQNEKTDDSSKTYTENLLQDRVRDKIGVEFIWGKVYEASRTFAFEFYYGAGINATWATRTDHDRYRTYTSSKDAWKSGPYPDYVDKSFYIRPTVLVGIKLRISF
jgi:hypothetical protein